MNIQLIDFAVIFTEKFINFYTNIRLVIGGEGYVEARSV